MSLDELLARVDALIVAGQALEARGTTADVSASIRHYDEAAAQLRQSSLSSHELARQQLARAWMNRANALQRLNPPATLPDSVRAYDEAIAVFRTLPLPDHPGYQNNLAAAWMNRGHALHLLGDPSSLAAAVESQRTALDLLRTLPLAADRSHRINLAAASLNLATSLLALGDLAGAHVAAREAMDAAAPAEAEDPAVADIALKARRACCDAIGRLLVQAAAQSEPTDPLADEASDIVDDGLALARRWESRGMPLFRPTAARLFRFGAQLYAAHLPDFLAEFILEHLDPARSTGAMPDAEDSLLAAAQALAEARTDLESHRTVFLDSPETTRLLDRLRDIRAAEARLAELRRAHS
ncbi:MAG TPA: hypothetical protein VG710_18580 [Opitutus sp.]|nr:hypothetical protein [Opitutus sp.]